MMPNTLQEANNPSDALGYTRTHSRRSYLLQNCIESIQIRKGLSRWSRYPGVSQIVVIRAPLITPHFQNCRTLAVDTFIDIVGQIWSGIARLCTPLQRTVVQRAPLPRWPQLSRVAAWARENVIVFQVIKRRCPATLLIFITSCPTSGERLFRGYIKFDFTVDERKGRLIPSRDK